MAPTRWSCCCWSSVRRWREELGRGASAEQAVERTLATAGRSVFFSGVTVAVSLAALTALPVPFLRSVGFTGLLIPVLSVPAALAFVSLSQVPTTEVKILATALALGILIDATIVRGVLAPALVAALAEANWWRIRARR